MPLSLTGAPLTNPIDILRRGLEGRYTIERELGRGGMATVYLAQDLRHGRQVAIKVLKPELAAVLGAERFAREIRLTTQLQHPQVLQVFDSGDAAGQLWYAMPYVEGESLRSRLDREAQLPLDDALGIAGAVGAALDYAHKHGIVHRDIKPENILLSAGHVVVADFGIARVLEAAGGEKLTETGLSLGTPAYMSPEQASADPRLDGRSDVYALGIVLYEMLAGTPPFTGPTAQSIMARHAVDPVPSLRTVRTTVPAGVEAAINRSLAKVPADRFATAGQFVDALTTVGSATVQVRSTPGKRRLALGVLTAVILLAFVTVWVVHRYRSPINPSAKVIAVLPFTPSTSDSGLTRLGRDLMVTVSATLDQVGELSTVDRYRVLSGASQSTPYSIDQGATLSRGFGAGSFVLGSLVRDGGGVRLDVGMYRTDTHAPTGPSIVVRAPPESLSALSDSITWALLRQIWRTGTPPSPNLGNVTTHSIPALRDFLEGERESVADHWPQAADAYHRAVTADSTFWVAGWRYNEAQGWMDGDVDTVLQRGYEAHLSLFVPRDRMIIETEQASATETFAAHLARAQQVATQFPNDWPAVFFYADHLIHTAPMIGHTKAEARAALEKAVALNPALTYAWDHLLQASLGQDSVDSRKALDALFRLREPRPTGERLWQQLLVKLTSSGGRVDPAVLDSAAKGVAASNVPLIHGFASHAFMAFGFPAEQIEFNRLVLRHGTAKQFIPWHTSTSAFSWAARGAWDSALVALVRVAASYPEEASGLDIYQMAVTAAWLGAIDANAAATRRGAALQYVGRPQAGEDSTADQAKLAWTDGMLAVVRGDPAALAVARVAVQRTKATEARFLDRSLAGFQLELRHAGRAAAESLAAIDAGVSEAELCWACDVYAISLDHLAAARGLLAASDTGRAMRELTWHEARTPAVQFLGELFAAPAYLQQARIENAQGRNEAAREDYEQFLRRYDFPEPWQQPLIVEAKAALRRLGGQTDAPGSAP